MTTLEKAHRLSHAGGAWKASQTRMYDLMRWQVRAKLNNTEMAKLLQVHRITYSRWINAKQEVPRWTAVWLTHVAPRLPLGQLQRSSRAGGEQ